MKYLLLESSQGLDAALTWQRMGHAASSTRRERTLVGDSSVRRQNNKCRQPRSGEYKVELMEEERQDRESKN